MINWVSPVLILHYIPTKAAANLLAMFVFGLIVAYCADRLSGETAELRVAGGEASTRNSTP